MFGRVLKDVGAGLVGAGKGFLIGGPVGAAVGAGVGVGASEGIQAGAGSNKAPSEKSFYQTSSSYEHDRQLKQARMSSRYY